MLRLTPTDPFLDRFVADLDREAPRRVAGQVDLDGASDEELEVARITWAARVLDEYRSVAVFSELLFLLARAQAPFSSLVTVQRLIGDELRHAKSCADILADLDPTGRVTLDLSDAGLPPDPDADPAARAFEIVVREILVSEAESVVMLRAYRDACQDAACAQTLDALLRDEVRHAAAGRHLVRALRASLSSDALRIVSARMDATVRRDLDDLRAAYRAAARGGPGRRYGASIEARELPRSPAQGRLRDLLGAARDVC